MPPTMPVTQLDDLCPDGVRIVVPWKDMRVGESVFVPCINTTRAKREAAAVAKRLQITLKCRVCVEDYRLGIRIWRSA